MMSTIICLLVPFLLKKISITNARKNACYFSNYFFLGNELVIYPIKFVARNTLFFKHSKVNQIGCHNTSNLYILYQLKYETTVLLSFKNSLL